MKRHVQLPGVRKWAGEDFLELQSEPLKALDGFFAQYGPCIVQGVEITANASKYNVSEGLVVLTGKNHNGKEVTMIVPFEGAKDVFLPFYLVLKYRSKERLYADESVRPIAYEYYADYTTLVPEEGVSYLKIMPEGNHRFADALQDEKHRFITDQERMAWNAKAEKDDPRFTDARKANGGNADTVGGIAPAAVGQVAAGKLASYTAAGGFVTNSLTDMTLFDDSITLSSVACRGGNERLQYCRPAHFRSQVTDGHYFRNGVGNYTMSEIEDDFFPPQTGICRISSETDYATMLLNFQCSSATSMGPLQIFVDHYISSKNLMWRAGIDGKRFGDATWRKIWDSKNFDPDTKSNVDHTHTGYAASSHSHDGAYYKTTISLDKVHEIDTRIETGVYPFKNSSSSKNITGNMLPADLTSYGLLEVLNTGHFVVQRLIEVTGKQRIFERRWIVNDQQWGTNVPFVEMASAKSALVDSTEEFYYRISKDMNVVYDVDTRMATGSYPYTHSSSSSNLTGTTLPSDLAGYGILEVIHTGHFIVQRLIEISGNKRTFERRWTNSLVPNGIGLKFTEVHTKKPAVTYPTLVCGGIVSSDGTAEEPTSNFRRVEYHSNGYYVVYYPSISHPIVNVTLALEYDPYPWETPESAAAGMSMMAKVLNNGEEDEERDDDDDGGCTEPGEPDPVDPDPVDPDPGHTDEDLPEPAVVSTVVLPKMNCVKVYIQSARTGSLIRRSFHITVMNGSNGEETEEDSSEAEL